MTTETNYENKFKRAWRDWQSSHDGADLTLAEIYEAELKARGYSAERIAALKTQDAEAVTQ